MTGKDSRMNPHQKQYNEIVQEIKQVETIIMLTADLVLVDEVLSREGKQRLKEIKKQVRRINGLLDKIQ